MGRTGFGRTVATLSEDVLAPLVTGRDCMATEFLNDLMWRAVQRLRVAGHAAAAISAVDLALWDLKGKLLLQPVYRLLGGPCRDRIELYATGDDLDWSMELGFRAFKVTNPCTIPMESRGCKGSKTRSRLPVTRSEQAPSSWSTP